MSDTPNSPDLEFLALQEALLGRYSLQRELGRGGMGVVYLAHEVRLDRPVALKLLPTHLAAQPLLRERFLQEARTAARLSHPNIVPIYAVDEVDDFVFFAMGFVEGESLGERVRRRGPVRPVEAARILREVAWALGHAHLQGVVHRDIKPDNILLEAEGGRALVTDFGIAHLSEGQGLTGVNEILGTAEFMSPEQASGETVDGRSDLYSLGIVGHYMLTGELPFQGATVAATLVKQLTQEAPGLAVVAPEVPKHLSEAMDRCLSKDPEARFGGGEELANALTTSLAVTQQIPKPLRLFAEQNRGSAGSIAVGSFLAISLPSVLIYDWGQDRFADPAILALCAAMVGVGLAAVSIGLLAPMTRRLLRSGYGHDELVRSLRSDVEEQREELASVYGGEAGEGGDHPWARRIAYASGATFVATVAAYPFIPFAWLGLFNALAGPLLLGSIGAGSVAGLVAAMGHQLKRVVPGERWLKFWEGPLGKGIFKLSKLRLGRVANEGAAYGHTEMAIGSAADRLFAALPRDVQQSFSELPEVVRTLEQDADKIRSRIKELDGLLAQIGSEGDPGESTRVAASPGVADKRDSLADDLRTTRDAAEARLSAVVTALETIRLELLRLHAGSGNVEAMTADISAAVELSEDIERVREGEREVERLLGGA